MATTLFLIRHGETEGSEVKRYKGSIDVLLSENGIGQMKKTSAFVQEYLGNVSSSKYSDYLKEIHRSSDDNPKVHKPENETSGLPDFRTSRLQAVYTSNLRRAVRSAEIIADPSGLQPVQIPEFRERSFGIWEGMTFSEIKEKYPSEFESWADDPVRYSPIGGESTIELRDRIIPPLAGILDNHKDGNIALVSHGGVNRIILCHFLGIPLENIFRVEQDYAAVNVIELWDKYPVVKLLNGGVTG
jgi:alpha-ribazole phosphatase